VKLVPLSSSLSVIRRLEEIFSLTSNEWAPCFSAGVRQARLTSTIRRVPRGDGTDAASRWPQVIDVEFTRKMAEWAPPGLPCLCCGTVTFAEPPAGAHQGLCFLRACAERRASPPCPHPHDQQQPPQRHGRRPPRRSRSRCAPGHTGPVRHLPRSKETDMRIKNRHQHDQ